MLSQGQSQRASRGNDKGADSAPFSSAEPTRLNEAGTPGREQREEQQDRQGNPGSQGIGHLARITTSHELEQRHAEARQDCCENEQDQEFHEACERMISGQYNAPRRRPPAWATLATLTGLALFLALGHWQLQRADEKRAILAQAAVGAEEVLRAPPAPDQPESAWRYRTVVLQGQYEAARQVLLDNMTQDGQVGYQVLTPLRLEDGGLVLVNRGWLPMQGPRAQLPDLPVDPSPREVVGQLNRLPSPGLRLGGNVPGAPGDPWPRRFLYPEHETLVAAFGEPLPDLQVQLAPEQPDGYSRRWEVVNMPPERHLGYAVQWFAFAAVLLVIYVWLGFIRGRRHEH